MKPLKDLTLLHDFVEFSPFAMVSTDRAKPKICFSFLLPWFNERAQAETFLTFLEGIVNHVLLTCKVFFCQYWFTLSLKRMNE